MFVCGVNQQISQSVKRNKWSMIRFLYAKSEVSGKTKNVKSKPRHTNELQMQRTSRKKAIVKKKAGDLPGRFFSVTNVQLNDLACLSKLDRFANCESSAP